MHVLVRRLGRPTAVRRLALAGPLLHLVVVVVAFLPATASAVSPLQAGGTATGLVFVTGLVGVWIALSERAPAAATEQPLLRTPLDTLEPGLLYTHRHLTEPGLLQPQEASR